MNAQLSKCEQYRYLLTRKISIIGKAGPAVFIMLNPSTADETHNDPTIRRCMRFAASWDCDELIVANLYALRTTDPSVLWQHDDPVGPKNDSTLASLANKYHNIVCAWGGTAPPNRVEDFVNIVRRQSVSMWCLGTTNSGQPRHPLYLPRDAALRSWQPED